AGRFALHPPHCQDETRTSSPASRARAPRANPVKPPVRTDPMTADEQVWLKDVLGREYRDDRADELMRERVRFASPTTGLIQAAIGLKPRLTDVVCSSPHATAAHVSVV